MSRRTITKGFISVLIGLISLAFMIERSRRSSSALGQGSMSTGGSTINTWRPGKNAKYVGPQACAKCHGEKVNQHQTAMGRAMEPAAVSANLLSHPNLTFRSGSYSYEIIRRGNQSIYNVTDGKSTYSEPLLYAFGQGKAGQTFVFRHNGLLHETRVSFYKTLDGLDWTMGYQSKVPTSLDDAAGRAFGKDETRECFGCHTTGAINRLEFQIESLIPGLSCEACHGPGAEHVSAMEAKRLKDKLIFNPGKMEPAEMSQEFCGSCHHSTEDVMTNKLLQGPISVRFQPYRLFTSRGHDPDDERLRCTSCHDPHADPVEDPAFYDPKCFVCHRSGGSLRNSDLAKKEEQEGRVNKACPVGERLCISCHMPKVAVAGTHFSFTDHRIRIVRAGDPFPH